MGQRYIYRHSFSDILSERSKAPPSAENTLSRESRSVAFVGDVYFWPTTWSVYAIPHENTPPYIIGHAQERMASSVVLSKKKDTIKDESPAKKN